MFKHSLGLLGRFAGRSNPPVSEASQRSLASLDSLLACVRAFAEHNRAFADESTPERLGLRRGVAALLAEFTVVLADPERLQALYQDRQPWPAVAPELLDALIAAGNAALGADEATLALETSATILAVRAGSRAGRRLRARALEALGDIDGAVASHEEYLKLVTSDDAGVGTHVAALRQRSRSLTECERVLSEHAEGADWDRGLALHAQGRWEEARPLLAGAVLELIERERFAPRVESALGDYVALLATAEADRLADSRTLVRAYADYVRFQRADPLPDPLLGGTRIIGVHDLRNLISGKSVCLVADSERLRQSQAEARLDSYDLVVRLDDHAVDDAVAGGRTDIHATNHRYESNWDRPVPIRLVFGRNQRTWGESVRRLVPGAQEYTGDRSLRWPVADHALIGDRDVPWNQTTGFTMLRLLDFLDVSPRIDLIGFDLAGQSHDREREWILARARETTDLRIALR